MPRKSAEIPAIKLSRQGTRVLLLLLFAVFIQFAASAVSDPGSIGGKHVYIKEKYGPDSCSKWITLSPGNQEVFKILPAYANAFRMTIYDKNANIVYASSNINEGWDGHINDAPAPEGAYFYMVQYNTIEKGRKFQKKLTGGIYIMRSVRCG